VTESTPEAPSALLLVAPGCPHCAGNLATLATLVKENVIGRLEVVNIATHPEVAQSVGVRSVPWLRLGSFELAGARSEAELRAWVQRVGDRNGLAEYFREQFEQGGLAEVTTQVRADPERLLGLLPLLEDKDAGVSVRIGMAAVLEDLADTGLVAPLVPELGRLSGSSDVRTRQDACHFLGLSHSAEAKPWLSACLQDDDPQVREIAAESLQELPDVHG